VHIGKIFEYKYLQSTELKNRIIKFHIEVLTDIFGDVSFVSSDLNKNEKLLDKSFTNHEKLIQELKIFQDNPILNEEFKEFKWNIQTYPKYRNGYEYMVRMVIKEELEIDFELMSSKMKLHNELNKKITPKYIQKRKKI
jgi:hypothetical protein